jgi:hypothetical protein
MVAMLMTYSRLWGQEGVLCNMQNVERGWVGWDLG